MPPPEDLKGEGFEVVGHQEPKEAEEEAQAAEEREVEGAAPPGAEVRPLDIYTALRLTIAQLANVAWQMLGLHADPLTGQVHKDIAQARLAIDATSALVDKLLPHLQGQEERDYRALLTDLRLNFVKQAGEGESQ